MGEIGKAPQFKYTQVHHVDEVTPEFIEFLKRPFHVNIFIKPYLSKPPEDKLSTDNPIVVGALTDGKISAGADQLTRLKVENARLKAQNESLSMENAELKRM